MKFDITILQDYLAILKKMFISPNIINICFKDHLLYANMEFGNGEIFILINQLEKEENYNYSFQVKPEYLGKSRYLELELKNDYITSNRMNFPITTEFPSPFIDMKHICTTSFTQKDKKNIDLIALDSYSKYAHLKIKNDIFQYTCINKNSGVRLSKVAKTSGSLECTVNPKNISRILDIAQSNKVKIYSVNDGRLIFQPNKDILIFIKTESMPGDIDYEKDLASLYFNENHEIKTKGNFLLLEDKLTFYGEQIEYNNIQADKYIIEIPKNFKDLKLKKYSAKEIFKENYLYLYYIKTKDLFKAEVSNEVELAYNSNRLLVKDNDTILLLILL